LFLQSPLQMKAQSLHTGWRRVEYIVSYAAFTGRVALLEGVLSGFLAHTQTDVDRHVTAEKQPR
jgi:hypothetical protein